MDRSRLKEPEAANTRLKKMCAEERHFLPNDFGLITTKDLIWLLVAFLQGKN